MKCHFIGKRNHFYLSRERGRAYTLPLFLLCSKPYSNPRPLGHYPEETPQRTGISVTIVTAFNSDSKFNKLQCQILLT